MTTKQTMLSQMSRNRSTKLSGRISGGDGGSIMYRKACRYCVNGSSLLLAPSRLRVSQLFSTLLPIKYQKQVITWATSRIATAELIMATTNIIHCRPVEAAISCIRSWIMLKRKSQTRKTKNVALTWQWLIDALGLSPCEPLPKPECLEAFGMFQMACAFICQKSTSSHGNPRRIKTCHFQESNEAEGPCHPHDSHQLP